MTARIVVTGTDTGVGKTVFSAGLAGLLDGFYWKPVQSGLDEETDSEVVARLSGLPAGRVVPEVYRLKMPLSPHRSAEIDGVAIEAARLSLPELPGPLIIEGAGGLMVPLNRQTRFIDIFREWQLPVILCARTALGTINHTLLSLEALRARSIPLLGIAFIGDEMADVLWVLICLANQTGVDLTTALEKNFEKKNIRDAERHKGNKKLK